MHELECGANASALNLPLPLEASLLPTGTSLITGRWATNSRAQDGSNTKFPNSLTDCPAARLVVDVTPRSGQNRYKFGQKSNTVGGRWWGGQNFTRSQNKNRGVLTNLFSAYLWIEATKKLCTVSCFLFSFRKLSKETLSNDHDLFLCQRHTEVIGDFSLLTSFSKIHLRGCRKKGADHEDLVARLLCQLSKHCKYAFALQLSELVQN